jgi:hypothetical protein
MLQELVDKAGMNECGGRGTTQRGTCEDKSRAEEATTAATNPIHTDDEGIALALMGLLLARPNNGPFASQAASALIALPDHLLAPAAAFFIQWISSRSTHPAQPPSASAADEHVCCTLDEEDETAGEVGGGCTDDAQAAASIGALCGLRGKEHVLRPLFARPHVFNRLVRRCLAICAISTADAPRVSVDSSFPAKSRDGTLLAHEDSCPTLALQEPGGAPVSSSSSSSSSSSKTRTATASTHSKLLALEAFRALLQLVVLDDSRDTHSSASHKTQLGVLDYASTPNLTGCANEGAQVREEELAERRKKQEREREEAEGEGVSADGGEGEGEGEGGGAEGGGAGVEYSVLMSGASACMLEMMASEQEAKECQIASAHCLGAVLRKLNLYTN